MVPLSIFLQKHMQNMIDPKIAGISFSTNYDMINQLYYNQIISYLMIRSNNYL